MYNFASVYIVVTNKKNDENDSYNSLSAVSY